MNVDIKQKLMNALLETGFDPDESTALADDIIEIDRRVGGILKLALRVEAAFDEETAQALARGLRELDRGSEAYLNGVITTMGWRNGRPPAEVRFP